MVVTFVLCKLDPLFEPGLVVEPLGCPIVRIHLFLHENITVSPPKMKKIRNKEKRGMSFSQ
jgi:hypothetical protein